ncbi:hypothetical protein [Micromonospora sp. NPDC005174]|uniref:hypothetical protein n=1 Tax=Micromonospora sp. NPDC005174 TaxID=3157018 RepID=UPI0033BA1193
MRWPDETLPLEVEAAFGADVTADPGTWTWTDLSDRLTSTAIALRAGASSADGRVSPGSCTVTLRNSDGALTPLHPMSPYWPNVELGTPLRVRLRRAQDAFGRTTSGNTWGKADSGETWAVAGTGQSVTAGVARHSHSDVNNLRLSVLPVSLTDSEQVADIATSALLTGGALVTGFVARYSGGAFYWLRVEFNHSATTVALKISRYSPSGGWVDLASMPSVPALTYAANTYLRARASVQGTTLALKVWPAAGTEPPGWHLTATDGTIIRPGQVGCQSWLVSGNTNTLPVAALHKNYTLRVDRFSGTADQWQPTYLPTGEVGQMESAMRITASGILRRLQQGTPPSKSALRRTIGGSSPVAYWPGEDGILSSQAGSATAGAAPLVVDGVVDFTPVQDYTAFAGSNTTRYGTTALANLKSGGSLHARLTADATAATAAVWTVGTTAQVDTLSVLSGDVVVLEWTTNGGTYTRWRLQVTTSLRTQVIAITAGGAATTLIDDASATPAFVHYAVSASVSAGTVTVRLYRDSSAPSTTFAGSIGGVTSVAVNPTGSSSTSDMPAGHIAVWATGALPVTRAAFIDSYGGVVREARRSWLGETAVARLVRLAAEDGITVDTVLPPGDAVQRMGWQAVGTALDLYRECEDADGGILQEQGFRLAYLTRAARYNRPTDLTVDLATYAVSESDADDPLTPIYDDQDVRNRWTVERAEGSFAVADDVASQRRGLYDDSIRLNLDSDAQLPHQAAWRVHLDADPDLRESTFPVDLAANPTLLDGWLSCQVGSRIVRINPPAQHRPGPLDRIVMGWSETIGPRSWLVQVVPGPAVPWDVAVADDPAQRPAADGASLTSTVSASATSLSISRSSGVGFTTDPTDFPLDLVVGGEQVRVSAISGTGSPQTATVSARAVNGVSRSWPAGTTVDVWSPAISPL